MKMKLPIKLLFHTFIVSLLCCLPHPVFAQENNDTEPPPSEPPLRGQNAMAAVVQNSTSLTVFFSEASDDARLEVCNADGTAVYAANGAVNPHSCLQVDTRCWRKGYYTVRLVIDGRLVNVNTIQLE